MLCCSKPQYDTSIFDDEDESKVEAAEVWKCTSLIKFPNNGSESNHTIAKYLRSHRALSCSDSISSGLMKMFTKDESSAKIRQDLEKKLGNVCSAFVDLISIAAFNKKMSAGICAWKLFSDRSLNETDFCGKGSIMDSAALGSTLEALGGHFKSAADAVVSLQKESCPEKCGDGYSRILCNAYYSIAVLFSREYYCKVPAQTISLSYHVVNTTYVCT